jgi:hypothetical protein
VATKAAAQAKPKATPKAAPAAVTKPVAKHAAASSGPSHPSATLTHGGKDARTASVTPKVPTAELARMSVSPRNERRLASIERMDEDEERHSASDGAHGNAEVRRGGSRAVKRKRIEDSDAEMEDGDEPEESVKGDRGPYHTGEIHPRPCDRCLRLRKDCEKQRNGAACYPCAKQKLALGNSKGQPHPHGSRVWVPMGMGAGHYSNTHDPKMTRTQNSY